MFEIPIFRAEAEVEGLAELVKANRTLSYMTLLQPARSSHRASILSAVASDIPQSAINDLYPTESILASTVCNLNDDVFPKWDTYQARSTPINKPDNLEHDEEQIIGHMVRAWLIDKDNNPIDETAIATVDDLPDLFHVCNASVIYTHWTKPELKERVATLIEEIEAGKKYVSMECLFTTFDYAMFDANDNLTVVPRTAATAFLTKHLRAYGGPGVYDDKRVCRLLRNFVFSGKGYVDAPANPDSLIFSAGSIKVVNFGAASYKNSLDDNAGVYLNNEQLVAANKQDSPEEETLNMSSELELLKSQLSETKEALKEATEANKTLEKQVAEAGNMQMEERVRTLESDLEGTQKEFAEAQAQIETLTKQIAELEGKNKELTDANVSLTQEIAEAEEKKVRANRISTLVDGGVDKADAETKVDAFANLNDEQFAILATELVKAASKKEEKEDEEEESKSSASEEESTEEDEAGETEASNADLEDAEANEDDDIAGAAAAENEAAEQVEVRQSIANWLNVRKGKKPSSDDEENS